ncbi:hypothetical protein QBC37DRAFT_378015 [Rhypophila decipiens]|uniref:Uncharacterized protein n=1 Tax=Rhypophila decipiens TaxID=261697 RepID=A0AAN6Y507_9PEZI|nr:hypothetical protein QBC37DRAFT_378015 [Rhypophila decipiens]
MRWPGWLPQSSGNDFKFASDRRCPIGHNRGAPGREGGFYAQIVSPPTAGSSGVISSLPEPDAFRAKARSLLGTAVHAFPGGLGGPGGGGRAGKGEGGGPAHGAKAHGGGPGGGGYSSGPSHSGPDWRPFLDLDESHPECPPEFPEILFYDNFANYAPGSQPSRDKWQYDLGHNYPGGPEYWGTFEIQSYTDDVENIVITIII